MVMRLLPPVPWEELVEAVFTVVAGQYALTGCKTIITATIRHRLGLAPHLLDASLMEINKALQSLADEGRVVPVAGTGFSTRWHMPEEPA